MGQGGLERARPRTAQPSPVVDAGIPGHGPASLSRRRTAGDGAVDLTPVGWTPELPMDLRRWITYGKRFARLGSASNWWIGDWIRYGNAHYGEKYGAASKTTGYDRQTLMNMAYVSSRFNTQRRREGVSWSHHAELAALPEEQQDAWLDLTEREHLSVRSLREEVRRGRSARKPSACDTDPNGTANDAGRACPYCGCPMPAARAASGTASSPGAAHVPVVQAADRRSAR